MESEGVIMADRYYPEREREGWNEGRRDREREYWGRNDPRNYGEGAYNREDWGRDREAQYFDRERGRGRENQGRYSDYDRDDWNRNREHEYRRDDEGRFGGRDL